MGFLTMPRTITNKGILRIPGCQILNKDFRCLSKCKFGIFGDRNVFGDLTACGDPHISKVELVDKIYRRPYLPFNDSVNDSLG
jgi:hypothetical protein